MKTLRKGTEPNAIELLVDGVELKPYAKMIKGIIENGIVVKINRYNLENLLCQLLEDYGEDTLIEKIKSLE